ncbi:MAG: adenylate/guanylate cyclase domain-containing protein [Proteobacteria bacterium]|nr:adenylate/guanylate cyclase domain-containing protein [Pseudomonadota bacterium]MBU1708784.1 adenylate/guanylate cyclase domain-containing protein [Pseudomonadota bacterium]
MATQKKGFLSLLLAILSVLFILSLYFLQNPFIEAFEAKTYDLRFTTMRGPVKADPNISIIAIDEKSIAEIGRFPWTRTNYAKLIDAVAAAGAKALIMDAFFPEKENDKTDREFAAAMARANNVTLAVAYDFNTDGSIKGVTKNIPILDRESSGSAHMNFQPDIDGINRRNMLVVTHEGKQVPSLGLKGAMAASDIKTITREDFAVVMGSTRIPLDSNGMMLINHTGPPRSYPWYSFSDVIQGQVPPEKLKDKIIFMGATALGIYDMRVTSFHHNMPGVEVHATIADNIINERFIRQTGMESVADMGLIVILGFLSYFITARMRLLTALPLLLAIAAAFTWLNYIAFISGHSISMIYPLSSLFLSYTVSGGFKFITLDRRSKEMRSIFSSYVSPKIVDQLVKDPSSAQIGGDTKEVTILFSDIKGFTTYSERNNPFKVVSTLNEYLAAMTKMILKFDGTVDKFLGDGIMAYWGAPLAQESHAELAVSCVNAMVNQMKQLQKKWEKSGTPPLSFRVGIHSGEVIAGNIGAKGTKMEYTVIGDNVNLAARLEGTAKFYGVDILVSENTFNLTKNKFIYRELDRIRVVGKSIPVGIYELLGPVYDSEKDKLEAIANKFKEGLTLYRGKKWGKSLEIFEMFCKVNSDDRASKLYVERCQYFMKNPPADDWDGVFDRGEK